MTKTGYHLAPPEFGAYGAHDAWMDEHRVALYDAALQEIIGARPDAVVVDAGCGQGTLSLRAAKAGAARVYAVDFDAEAIKSVVENAAGNGVADKVTILHADARTVELPEQVDVIIADSLTAGLGGDSHVAMLRNLRRYLRPGGVMVPAKMNNYIQLLNAQEALYGLTFNYDVRHRGLPKDELLTDDRELYLPVDFQRGLPPNKIAAQALVQATRSGRANAVQISHDMQFTDDSSIETKATGTLMLPLIVFLKKPIDVTEGKAYKVGLKYSIDATDDIAVGASIDVTPARRRKPPASRAI